MTIFPASYHLLPKLSRTERCRSSHTFAPKTLAGFLLARLGCRQASIDQLRRRQKTTDSNACSDVPFIGCGSRARIPRSADACHRREQGRRQRSIFAARNLCWPSTEIRAPNWAELEGGKLLRSRTKTPNCAIVRHTTTTSTTKLFACILHNPCHVLHKLLTPIKQSRYSLRPRSHNRELPMFDSLSQKCFLARMLYK